MERDGEVGVHLDGPRDGRVSRPEVIEGRFGRWLRTKAERARIAAESLVPAASVTDVAQRHGTTRWQIYDWRRKLRTGQFVVPESVAAQPVFAELVVAGVSAGAEMSAEAAAARGKARHSARGWRRLVGAEGRGLSRCPTRVFPFGAAAGLGGAESDRLEPATPAYPPRPFGE